MNRAEIIAGLARLDRAATGEAHGELLDLAQAAFELLTQGGRELDAWEKACMGEAVTAIERGWPLLARLQIVNALALEHDRSARPLGKKRALELERIDTSAIGATLQGARARRQELFEPA